MDPNSTHELVESAVRAVILSLPTQGPAGRLRVWLERLEPTVTFVLAFLIDLSELRQHR